MIFKGISKTFSLKKQEQYDTIGAFWDELAQQYGLENLQGLGYKWQNGQIWYAIGLKNGEIDGCNLCIQLPDDGWQSVDGKTDELPAIYNEIYRYGVLRFEIESFYENGSCHIKYYRKGE